MSDLDPIPESPRTSFWDASPKLRALLSRKLPARTFTYAEPLFAAMGRAAVDCVSDLASVADRESPRLVTHDARGNRIDRVDYHPAYREMEEIVYGSGLVAMKYDGSLPAEHRPFAQTIGFGIATLFGMAEAGLSCPVCMTDGAARVLVRFGTEDQIRRVVPRLASRARKTRFTGAMFLTERWGGSDVGANRTVARKGADGRFFLTGEKWFCSNVDAKVILATARPEGAPEGTKGLRTFLVLAEGNPGIRVRRLKEKLGVRSMPTGEVDLVDAPAEEVGGFAAIAEMLNMSRLYNAVISVAVVARAIHEAKEYGARRRVFGKPVLAHPLAEETLADLEAENLAALHLTFEAIAALGRADSGDESAARLFRVLVPIAKLTTAKLAVPAVSEAMELIGGNAYIEESPLPRLLRDAQVLPIWEGTTNVLVLDTLRVARKGDGLEPLVSLVSRCFPDEARMLAAELPTLSERDARGFVDRLARQVQLTLLIEAGEEKAAARLQDRPLGLLPGARPHRAKVGALFS